MLRPWIHPPADLSVFHAFAPPPTGGGHQFMRALCGELSRRGKALEHNRLHRRTPVMLCNSYNFSVPKLERALRRHPRVRKVHRVDGPLKGYRGMDDGTDDLIMDINRRWADATIFQSRFSLEAHRKLGYDPAHPVIIPNTPDPELFHSRHREPFHPDRPLRVVAVSWSDNPNKGRDVYTWLDRHLDPERHVFTFVGRIQAELHHARHIPPLPSDELAGLLRTQDVYLTASLHDPCSNSLMEALACGLPAVYRDSGGHPELAGDAGLRFTAAEEIPALLDRIASAHPTYRHAIHVPDLATIADRYLQVLFPEAAL